MKDNIFKMKYAHPGADTWSEMSEALAEVIGPWDIFPLIEKKRFIPGGRFLYYARRQKNFVQNCYMLRALEDTREDWANLSWKTENCLMTGGGVGIDYSIYRQAGHPLSGIGGEASGPIKKMIMINEMGRVINQGGTRRSALYASLSWKHPDIWDFLHAKDIKTQDAFPLDGTNISVNYDTEWLLNYWETGDVGDVFRENCKQAGLTAEPGFSFNFFDRENETLRNACTEIVSEDDNDCCILGSINMANCDSLSEFKETVELGTMFLIQGTIKGEVPYPAIAEVRARNRRLGLGLMGLHEWLLKRGYRYAVNNELRRWLQVYRDCSEATARTYAEELGISRPVAVRAIAPTGTIGILAETTTGIEPIFAVAYKRRYGNRKYQYVVDATAQKLIDLGIKIPETASSITVEDRVAFQADIQDYVDQGISSTINLPKPKEIDPETIARYAHRLRGVTVYPNGSRGGQPLTPVSYDEAKEKGKVEYTEPCKEGVCGL